jgi:hypothetical protein
MTPHSASSWFFLCMRDAYEHNDGGHGTNVQTYEHKKLLTTHHYAVQQR